jgi:hypothetical protein
MSPRRDRPRPARFTALATLGALVALATALAGCGIVSTTPPAPTPADSLGIVSELSGRGIRVGSMVSGDAGCPDPILAPTAIRLTAGGLDQPTDVTLHLYIFRNRASYEKLRGTIDQCARSYVTDPATFESIDAYSPFVVAGQGPWGERFREAVRDSLRVAAGTGG